MDINILNWVNFAKVYLQKENIDEYLSSLDEALGHRSYLVGDVLTDADCQVFKSLSSNKLFISKFTKKNIPDNITRYYCFLEGLEGVKLFVDNSKIIKQVITKKEIKVEKSSSNSKFEEGGKFVGLKEALEGQVVVRFPPEASGFLHIGHAKAALINQHYKEHYKGKLIMRFDDTNPAKESSEFEHVILEDVKKLGINYDVLSYSSDYFDTLMEYCEKLIRRDQAYADNTDPETMKKERELCKSSKCRSQSVDENLRLWGEMKNGSDIGITCCIRLKLDMSSKNGCMRDPTIYRCKAENHVRTGDKYKVYPTYDFACPIVDSIEGVTHSLRTSEYNDRNEQFNIILDMVSLRKPFIADYSRLSLQNTVLSKRKLTWIVDNGHVDGWNDPRMPTVRGILRHGMTVDGLKEFVIAQGFGRANVVMEWDKIWAFNKKIIDPIAPRYTGLSAAASDLIQVFVRDQLETVRGEAALHPKNADIGNKEVYYTHTVLVERSDVDDFVVGSNVTFINWGNLRIESIKRDTTTGIATTVEACLNLEDRDFKKTLKVTWLPLGPNNEVSTYTIPVSVVTFGDLISKSILDKDDDFKNYINAESRKEECLLGDRHMNTLKKGDVIQIQRKGYFVCDEPYQQSASATGQEYPLVLINIPEGNKKERVTTGMKQKCPNTSGDAYTVKSTKKDTSSKEPATKVTPPNEAAEKVKPPKEVNEKVKPSKEVTENVKSSKEVKEKVKPSKEVKEKVKPSKEVNDKVEITKTNQMEKQTRLGLEVTKEDNFSKWYTEVITKSEMIAYYNISGCYTMLPDSFFIWEQIQCFINKRIKLKNVKNCNFPLLIPEESLIKEKDHIADFSPEVAWVTRCGDKNIEKPMAIRPTSETVMYPYFADKIKSHRDMPFKVNQWVNVLRWEFKDPVPFLRTREFLWQEGHTAYGDQSDAIAEVYDILDLYGDVYENLLAIPVVKGRKTEKEKFAGGDFTTTTEVYIAGNGRAIQGATSHHLGQNFSKMFNIKFQTATSESQYAYQNSWGMTTRTIGIAVMVHGDNKGLVLPPLVAEYQVVIVPCGVTTQTSAEDIDRLLAKCCQVRDCLTAANIRVNADLELDYRSSGWKFNYWELKGVPIRIEIGSRDLAQSKVVLCIRQSGLKESVSDEGLGAVVAAKLDEIHWTMLAKARKELDDHRMVTWDMEELCRGLDRKMLVTAPFCGDKACEELIKITSAMGAVVEEGAPSMGAKSLCIPLEQPDNLGDKCINSQCSKLPKFFTMFGRSY